MRKRGLGRRGLTQLVRVRGEDDGADKHDLETVVTASRPSFWARHRPQQVGETDWTEATIASDDMLGASSLAADDVNGRIVIVCVVEMLSDVFTETAVEQKSTASR